MWQAVEKDYAAVITPVIIGPEENLYFTTGKDESYGNLHAFDNGGKILILYFTDNYLIQKTLFNEYRRPTIQ